MRIIKNDVGIVWLLIWNARGALLLIAVDKIVYISFFIFSSKMYHILIPTPKTHWRDATSHLLEHCVSAPYHSNYEDFIHLYPSTEAKTLDFYTQFSFSRKEDMEKFIPLLSKKVKKSDFDREKQRLQDELLDPSFFDRLRSQLLSQQDWIYPNFSELLDYQEKRYKNYWILDESYNILQEGDGIDCDSTQQLSSRRVTLDTIDYFLLAIPFESAKDWYLFDFCQRMSQAWIDYQTRYVEKLYFPYQFYNSLRSEAGYLIYAKGAYEQMKVLDQKFFDTFKNFYLQKLISNKGNLLAQLLNKKTEKPESVISDILYSQVQQFFAGNLY